MLKSTSFLSLNPFLTAARRLKALQLDLGKGFATQYLETNTYAAVVVHLCPFLINPVHTCPLGSGIVTHCGRPI